MSEGILISSNSTSLSLSDLPIADSCSHNRAVLFYAESIGLPKSFPSIPCSWKALQGGRSCLDRLADFNVDRGELEAAIGSMDEAQVVYMGEQVTRR